MVYIYAKVVWVNKKSILCESNGVGYKINVTCSEKYIVDKINKIYVYKLNKIDHKNNLIEELYGFSTNLERMLFIDLISLNGIGAITAMNILNNDINYLIECIASNDIENIKTLNNITQKLAITILNSLSDKYVKYLSTSSKNLITKKTKINNELIYALKKLGYKNDDLKYINDIEYNENDDVSELITKSIKLIALKHQEQHAS